MRSKEEIYEYAKTMDKTDFSEILKCARRISKLKDNEKYNIKIAVTGTSALQFFTMALKVMLFREHIFAKIYEGHYNGIQMDILDEESELYKLNPDIVIILTDYRSIERYPEMLSEDRAVEEWVNNQMSYYKAVWEHLGTKLEGSHIFQSNIVLPFTRVMGNLEGNCYFSKRTCLLLLNMELARQRYNYVTIVDLEYVAAFIGKNNWFDDSGYMLYKTGFALQYMGIVGDIFARQIAALQGKVRKCLVLDLDNTLWGGIVGEEGYDGIQLAPNNAAGESFLAFQKYVSDLKSRGVILAVCSKNDYETAKEAFIKNEYMILKFDDFASFVANWDDKASNLKKISSELNIGTDSLVFFDDNPAERELIRKYLPEVEVIDVPDNPADYVKVLEQSFAFDWLQITKEDLQRNYSYYNNKSRQELQNLKHDYNEYLKALDMHALVCEPEKHDMERFNQLINKSNQFNLRTIRYTEAELMNMRLSKQYRLLAIKLADKFEKYGIISCIILKKEGSTLFIDSFVMSCRVFKRGIEYFAFKNIIKAAEELGCSKIIGEYIPTRKNGIVKDLYKDIGFEYFESVLRRKEEAEMYVYDTSRLFDKITYFS